MTGFFSNMKISHIIIVFILIVAGINFTFYNHIYKNFDYQISREKAELVKMNRKIKMLIHEFNKHKNILTKIQLIKDKIMETKYEIGYLKTKNKSRRDIITSVREILLKSNVNLTKMELISEQYEKKRGKVLLKFEGDATLKNFISLLDIIENRQDFLTIESYNIKNIKKNIDVFKIEMIFKFVYIIS